MGGTWIDKLVENGSKSAKAREPSTPPAFGTYASPAVAVLITMLEFIER